MVAKMDVNLLWVGGVIGAVIGGLVAFIGNFCLQVRKEWNEKKAIRTMLKIEIKNNLDTLERTYNYVLTLEPMKGQDDTSWYRGLQLSAVDEMVFNKSLWNSKSPIYAIALNEDEIGQIENFYNLLEQSKTLHKKMQEINQTFNSTSNKNDDVWYEYYLIGDKWELFEERAQNSLENGQAIIDKL